MGFTSIPYFDVTPSQYPAAGAPPPSLLLLQLMNRKQQQVISIIVNIGLNINFSLKRVAADLIAGFI